MTSISWRSLRFELVATDAGQVVALVVEERVLEVGAGRLDRGRLARTGTLVDLEQGVVAGGRDVALLLPLAGQEVEVAHEALDDGVVLEAERAHEHEDRQAALAGDAGAGGDVLARLGLDVELDPLTAVGVDGAGDDRLGVAAGLEDHAGRTHELAHDDALGAVDDERALVRHHREVAHEDGLFLDLTRDRRS